MILETPQELSRNGPIFRMNLDRRVNDRTDQPAPNRSLMVSSIASTKVAIISRFVIGMSRRQRTQTDWRQKSLGHDLEDGRPARPIEHRVIQRDGENLVR